MVKKSALKKEITALEGRVRTLEDRSNPNGATVSALRRIIANGHDNGAAESNGSRLRTAISRVFNAVEGWEQNTQERLETGDLVILKALQMKTLGAELLTEKDVRQAFSILRRYDRVGAQKLREQLRKER